MKLSKNHMISGVILSVILKISISYGIDISGTVLNCCGEPISGALVELPSTSISCITDSVGKFRLTGLAIKSAILKYKPSKYDKLEYYDLYGRRILNVENMGNFDIRSFHKKIAASCCIARLAGPQCITDVKILTLLPNQLENFTKKSDRNLKLGKIQSIQDSLRVSLTGFTTKSVPFSNDTSTVETIYIPRIVDGFSDCGQIKNQSDSAIQIGYGVLKDSLLLSQAGYEWSAGNFSIPVSGLKSRCVLDVIPWGLYSKYIAKGNSGSYSIITNGCAGLTGIKNLSPIITKTGYTSGLVLAEGSTIDKSSMVVLANGTVQDKYGRRQDNVNQMQDLRSSLPFDSLILRTLYQIKRAEYYGYFRDSSEMHKDTVPLNSIDAVNMENTKVINAHVKISGTFSDKSIIASGTLTLQSGANLSNCIIMASKITINGGNTDGCIFYSTEAVKIKEGTHNSQFFSCDSIVISRNVKTGPASLWVSKKTAQNNACIYFQRNKSLCGTAISFKDTMFVQPNTSIYLDSGSAYTGYLVTDGYINIKFVDITGFLYAMNFETAYNNLGYLNYFFGVSLHAPVKPLFFPFIGQDPINLNFMETHTTSICY